MRDTYQEAISKVFEDEGGYSNDADDPGGPTNWGITIADARMYWKSNATSSDVRRMPKSVAEEIYRKHYAIPLHYDDLPAGVDYAVLDFGINSGISRSAKYLQTIIGVNPDGTIGPGTLAAVTKSDPKALINRFYDKRLAFLQGLGTWSTFGRGWSRRCSEGRALALSMVDKYQDVQITRRVPNVESNKTVGQGLLGKILDTLMGFIKAISGQFVRSRNVSR